MIPAPPDPPELDSRLWADFPNTRVALDIGANAGQTFSKILTFAEYVVAFEPWPESYEYLVENYGDDSRISILQEAVARETGTIELLAAPSKIETGQLVSADIPGMEWSMDAAELGQVVEISAVSIDDFYSPDPDWPAPTIPGFIKIDVEGHELEVLMGAQRTIEANRPHMLIEIHSEHLGDAIVNLLYTIYDLDVVRHPHYENDSLLWRSHFWIRCFPKR